LSILWRGYRTVNISIKYVNILCCCSRSPNVTEDFSLRVPVAPRVRTKEKTTSTNDDAVTTTVREEKTRCTQGNSSKTSTRALKNFTPICYRKMHGGNSDMYLKQILNIMSLFFLFSFSFSSFASVLKHVAVIN